MNYKIILFLLISTFSFIALSAQDYVNTEPQNKNVILEEFTGVRCPNCPAGHTTAAQILEANPGRVWVVGYHPFNSSFTEPYAGDPDFRRHHPDAFYTIPYCGTSRFMPSAFINRRIYMGERIQSRTVWANYTTQHLAEASPLNVGLATSYDEATKQLDIILEVFYTDDMTDENTLNLFFTESGLVAQQSGGGVNYIHKHVFRETFTDQWGDIITEPTTQGSYIVRTYSFDNSAEEYDMAECEVIAYVVNSNNEEIISGIGCHVGENTNTNAPIANFTFDMDEVIGQTTLNFTDQSMYAPTSWDWTFEGGTPATSDEQNPTDIIYTESGTYEISLTATNENGSDTYSEEIEIEILISDINEVVSTSIQIFPNPGNGKFVIDLSDLNAKALSVYDIHGNTVYYDSSPKSGIINMDLNHLASGLYFINIDHEKGVISQRLIIQ